MALPNTSSTVAYDAVAFDCSSSKAQPAELRGIPTAIFDTFCSEVQDHFPRQKVGIHIEVSFPQPAGDQDQPLTDSFWQGPVGKAMLSIRPGSSWHETRFFFITFITLAFLIPLLVLALIHSAGKTKMTAVEKKFHGAMTRYMKATAVLQGTVTVYYFLSNVMHLQAMGTIVILFGITRLSHAQLCVVHQVACVVIVPAHVLLVWLGMCLPDNPFVAISRCTLPIFAVIHFSFGWFFSTSFSVIVASFTASFLRDGNHWEAHFQYALGLANLLAFLTFLAKRASFSSLPDTDEHSIAQSVAASEQSRGSVSPVWTFAICAAAPSSVVLVLRRVVETKGIEMTPTHWSALAAALLSMAILCRFPPKSWIKTFDSIHVASTDPSLAIEWSQITTCCRAMAVCQLAATIFYLSGRDTLVWLQIPVPVLVTLFTFVVKPGLHTMGILHASMCFWFLPLSVMVSAMMFVRGPELAPGTFGLWPPCLGLPFFGAMLHDSIGAHLSEVLFVFAVMICHGKTPLRIASFAATVLSTIALCVKLLVLQYRLNLRSVADNYTTRGLLDVTHSCNTQVDSSPLQPQPATFHSMHASEADKHTNQRGTLPTAARRSRHKVAFHEPVAQSTIRTRNNVTLGQKEGRKGTSAIGAVCKGTGTLAAARTVAARWSKESGANRPSNKESGTKKRRRESGHGNSNRSDATFKKLDQRMDLST